MTVCDWSGFKMADTQEKHDYIADSYYYYGNGKDNIIIRKEDVHRAVCYTPVGVHAEIRDENNHLIVTTRGNLILSLNIPFEERKAFVGQVAACHVSGEWNPVVYSVFD